MDWFSKAIAYDQKRKLMIFPIVGFLPLLLLIMNFWSNVSFAEEYNAPVNYLFSYGDTMTFYMFLLLFFLGVAVVSIGLRDKSERGYMVSIPIKRKSIILTKIVCSEITISVPLLIGFIIEIINYLNHRTFLVEMGYPFLDRVLMYLALFLIGTFIVGVVFLLSLIFNNIKFPVALSVVGFIALIGLINIFYGIDVNNIMIGKAFNRIMYFIKSMSKMPFDTYNRYDFSFLGQAITIIGFIMLVYTLVVFIAGRFTNDIYNNLYCFKVSKIISSVIIYLFIFIVVCFIAVLIGDILFRSSFDNRNNFSVILCRTSSIMSLVLTPIWIKLIKKINKKLEERFN